MDVVAAAAAAVAVAEEIFVLFVIMDPGMAVAVALVAAKVELLAPVAQAVGVHLLFIYIITESTLTLFNVLLFLAQQESVALVVMEVMEVMVVMAVLVHLRVQLKLVKAVMEALEALVVLVVLVVLGKMGYLLTCI